MFADSSISIARAGDLPLVSTEAVSLRSTGIESVTGEAFINNRKNKLIPAYELKVVGSWQGKNDSLPQV